MEVGGKSGFGPPDGWLAGGSYRKQRASKKVSTHSEPMSKQVQPSKVASYLSKYEGWSRHLIGEVSLELAE